MSEGHLEAKLYALRKSKDGVIVSIVCHPNDITSDLMNLDIGARLMVGWSEIGENESPKPNRAAQGGISAQVANRAETPRETGKPRRKFHELSAPEQAGILSNDLEFQLYVSTRFPASTALDTAEFIRESCGVSSRSQITSENVAWKNLITDFRAWQTDQRFADARR